MTKPTVEDLGIDVGAQTWHRSGGPAGSIEVAFVGMEPGAPTGSQPVSSRTPGEWVLIRVAGDPAGRVLVYDRFEWECFLDGVKKGEFDDATELRTCLAGETPHGNGYIAIHTGHPVIGCGRPAGHAGARHERTGKRRRQLRKHQKWRTTGYQLANNYKLCESQLE
jgi:hypothetical protein